MKNKKKLSAEAAPTPSAAPAAAPAPAAKQPFSWWNSSIPKSVQATFSEKFFAMHRRELNERASLLRRLGYDRDEVRRRLEAYEGWQYEPFASSPLRAEVEKLVDAVFAPKSARTTLLSPGS